MNESRLVELEIKIAYQDDLLQSLNEVVTSQQLQIDKLAAVCRMLTEQTNNLLKMQDNDSHIDQTPPHY